MKIKKEYSELLLLITPGPIGRGLTIKQAAQELDISYIGAKKRLEQFKVKYPDAWKKFNSLKEEAQDRRYKLRWKEHFNQQIGMKTECDMFGKKIKQYRI